MNSKVGSLEEKVKLPPTETISRCYQPQGNRKVIRILTVAVYVLCVSLAAIMLSLYYIFIWDPSIRPFATKSNNCDKIVIPEKIAIRLLNSSEVTAEAFYKHILEQYRILNHLQQQRQLFLQKQQLQLQQLTAANKFQEVFATATIIQANRNDQYKRVMATANGTLLLQPRPPILALEQQQQQQQQQQKQYQQQQEQEQQLQLEQQQEQLQQQLQLQERQQQQLQLQLQQQMAPILDTTTTHIKRKSHRKHYNNHHRHNTRKSHRKPLQPNNNQETAEQQHQQQQQTFIDNSDIIMEPATSVMEQNYTPIPIPLILNTREEKRPHHHEHSAKLSPSYSSSSSSMTSSMQPRRRTTLATSIYDRPSYMNPFLTGELIFEK